MRREVLADCGYFQELLLFKFRLQHIDYLIHGILFKVSLVYKFKVSLSYIVRTCLKKYGGEL